MISVPGPLMTASPTYIPIVLFFEWVFEGKLREKLLMSEVRAGTEFAGVGVTEEEE